MAPISARTAVLAKWAVIPAALIVSGVVVSQASYSAFSATTTDGVTNWTAGKVILSNTSTEAGTGTATFNAGNLKPGDTGSKCITVTSSGSLASKLKLYTEGYTTNDPATETVGNVTTVTKSALAPNINLVITEGSDCAAAAAATTNIYSGNLTELATAKIDYTTGLSDWQFQGKDVAKVNESRSYQIKYTLLSSTPNTAQGGTASVSFKWDARTPQT